MGGKRNTYARDKTTNDDVMRFDEARLAAGYMRNFGHENRLGKGRYDDIRETIRQILGHNG